MNIFHSTAEHWVKGRLWRCFSLINCLLLPFSLLYLLCHVINYHILKRPEKLSKPIICVGNLVVGGSGKTPVALKIASICQEYGLKVAFIGHGYKAEIITHTPCVRIDPERHTAREIGDEALLLSYIAPTYIATKRASAAKMAISDGAEIIILDDGLQDNSINKDFSIIVLDSGYMLGNGMLLPSGPLRELPLGALDKANSIIITGQDLLQCADAKHRLLAKYSSISEGKIISGHVQILNSEELTEPQYIVLLGVSDPHKILKAIKILQIHCAHTFIFPDHHNYSADELKHIYAQAQKLECKVLTTSKDRTKIDSEYLASTVTIEIGVRLEKIDILYAFLQNYMAHSSI